jgi:CBS domain-containing protein
VTDQTRYPGPSDTVRVFVSDNLICIEPDATLQQVAHRLTTAGVGALVVTDGDRVVGIISERDVVGAVASGKDLGLTMAAELGNSRAVLTAVPANDPRLRLGWARLDGCAGKRTSGEQGHQQ